MSFESNLEGAGAYEEIKKGKTVQATAIAIAVMTGLFGYVIMPIVYIALNASAIPNYAAQINSYLYQLITLDFASIINTWYIAFPHTLWLNGALGQFVYLVLPGLFALIVYLVITKLFKHSKTPNIFGDARYAKEDDIKFMDKANLISNVRGELMVLGFFKKKMLRLTNHLSVLMLAPPGTGKTVGFIVPSIVNMDRVSIMVHDMKPELFTLTSGWRNRLGPCYEFKWSAKDYPKGRLIEDDELAFINPSLIARDEKGEMIRDPETGRVKSVPIFYPSWNPLSSKSMPRDASARDMYIDRLANVLCPDPTQGDKFWTGKARAVITAFIYYMLGKVQSGNYNSFPDAWKGAEEVSFPLLVDWFAEIQMTATEGGDDPLRSVFKEALAEAKLENERARSADKEEPFPPRCLATLAELMNTPDKTRGSILVTMEQALSIFRQEAVRQRTMKSDLDFADLRGVPSHSAQEREEGKRKLDPRYKPQYAPEDYEPVSIYICVSLEDAKVLSVISGLFIELANSYLVANGPGSRDDRGNKVGPYPFTFLLDEAPQMPRLEQTVVNGPAVGRSKEVNYVIVGQDFAQIQSKYSKDDVETLISTTAVKCVLSQNNNTTAERISKMVGKMTYKSESYSDSGGKSGGGKVKGALSDISIEDFLPKQKKKNKNESWQSVELLKPSDLMSLPNDKHILIVQNFTNRPIKADTALFFKYPEIAKKVFNTRTKVGPLPAPPMPLHQMRSVSGSLQRESDFKEALKSKASVIIATPRDLGFLKQDAWGKTSDEKLYAAVEIELDERGPIYVKRPENGTVLVTSNLSEIAALARRRRVVVFDRDTFETQIKQPLEALGLPPLPSGVVSFLRDRSTAIGQTDYTNLYDLITEGGTSIDVASNPDLITPSYTVECMEIALEFIMGVEEQIRMVNEYYEQQKRSSQNED